MPRICLPNPQELHIAGPVSTTPSVCWKGQRAGSLEVRARLCPVALAAAELHQPAGWGEAQDSKGQAASAGPQRTPHTPHPGPWPHQIAQPSINLPLPRLPSSCPLSSEPGPYDFAASPVDAVAPKAQPPHGESVTEKRWAPTPAAFSTCSSSDTGPLEPGPSRARRRAPRGHGVPF